MCGFVGLYLNKDSSLEDNRFPDVLRKITSTLKNRGPDHQGIYINKTEKLGFGFQRLSIIDLKSSANQPMTSNNKDWIIVYNGEIYNYKFLKNNLNKHNSFWKSESDTEVILECISEYGFLNTIKKLNGMFAIAAYCFSEKTLWLARDKFGEKPLYFNYSSKEGLFFASELKSFSNLPGFKKEISEEAFSQYIRYGYVPDPLSIYKNTYKLEPGYIIKYDKKNLIIKRKYWDNIDAFAKAKEQEFKGSFAEAKEEVKRKIDISTRNRLVSDVPLGLFLSGGIDSSNLVLSLHRQNIQCNTFSIGFNDKKTNEMKYANTLANQLNTKHYFKYISHKDCIDNINSISKTYDEPFADPSQIPTYMLCKFAKENITVAISGEGADELFGGYPRYCDISNYWHKIKNNPKFFSYVLDKMSMYFGSSKLTKIRSIGKKMRKYSHTSLDNLYMDEVSRWRPDEKIYINSLFENSFFEKKINKSIFNNSDPRYLMMRDIITYLPSNLLVKTDRASMANSLEIRSPFLDSDLVNFVWSLPDQYIYKRSEKALLKEILKEKTSEKFVSRKKQGFEPPLYNWLKGPLNKWAKDLLFNDDNFIDKKQAFKLMQRFEKGEKKLTYKIWTLIMFKAWKSIYY